MINALDEGRRNRPFDARQLDRADADELGEPQIDRLEVRRSPKPRLGPHRSFNRPRSACLNEAQRSFASAATLRDRRRARGITACRPSGTPTSSDPAPTGTAKIDVALGRLLAQAR
jgi:hypothetical protein